jgi:hypothetical protein
VPRGLGVEDDDFPRASPAPAAWAPAALVPAAERDGGVHLPGARGWSPQHFLISSSIMASISSMVRLGSCIYVDHIKDARPASKKGAPLAPRDGQGRRGSRQRICHLFNPAQKLFHAFHQPVHLVEQVVHGLESFR